MKMIIIIIIIIFVKAKSVLFDSDSDSDNDIFSSKKVQGIHKKISELKTRSKRSKVA